MNDILIKPGSKVLFQGDSITDCQRDRNDNRSMGFGYANFIASWLSALYPDYDYRFINKGISGDRICDLEARWTEDCIALKPDWVSILIGINDVLSHYQNNGPTPEGDFAASYRRILDRLRTETEAKLVIIDPFLLYINPEIKQMREYLDPKIEIIQILACEFGAIHIPMSDIFLRACKSCEPDFWAQDGIHPTQPGHALIAQSWINAISSK